jgi:hypothetical protein
MIGPLSRWWDSGRVDVYTVHEPPQPPADRIDRAERLEFVRDGFSWPAALFGPLWLAAKREWLWLGLYAAAAVLLGLVASLLGGAELWVVLGNVGLALFLGFEASTLRRISLERRNWTELGTVTGRGLAECERRFFETWLPEQPAIAIAGGRGGPSAPTTSVAATPRRPGWRQLLGTRA